jgi:hypothetical protein
VAILAAGGIFLYQYYFHAKPFAPVELSVEEQVVLDAKLKELRTEPRGARRSRAEELGGIQPVPPGMDEKEFLEQLSRERRTIVITEREINAVLHHNTDLENKLRIHFYDDGIGGEAIIDVPPDFPMLGGKTIRARAEVAAYLDLDGRLAIVVEDVSLNGVPLPSAWLFDLKGVNLVEQYENRDPLIRAIADGIEEFEVRRGEVHIRLAK